MKTKERKKQGISLIVLVITIIVIVILALAVILSINKNNPIENARKARFLNDIKTIQEEVDLYVAHQYVENNGEYDINSVNIADIEEIPDEYKEKITIENGKVVLIENKVSNKEKIWASEVGIEVKTQEEKHPVIPVGFKHTEGTIDTGYVIQNEVDGNEFVWVPVNTIEEFVRKDGYSEDSNLQDYVSSGMATEPLNYNDEIASQNEINEYNAMIESVKKYHGFYVGRYESSQNESGIVQSKKRNLPLTNIKWTDLNGGALEKSRAVYPDNTNKIEGEAVSTLIYGIQWDQIIRWLEKDNPGISTNSTNYGNYINSTFEYTDINGEIKMKTENSSTKVPTGSAEHNRTKNIYDLCR